MSAIEAAVEMHLDRADAGAVKRLAQLRGMDSAELIAESVRKRVHRS